MDRGCGQSMFAIPTHKVIRSMHVKKVTYKNFPCHKRVAMIERL